MIPEPKLRQEQILFQQLIKDGTTELTVATNRFGQARFADADKNFANSRLNVAATLEFMKGHPTRISQMDPNSVVFYQMNINSLSKQFDKDKNRAYSLENQLNDWVARVKMAGIKLPLHDSVALIAPNVFKGATPDEIEKRKVELEKQINAGTVAPVPDSAELIKRLLEDPGNNALRQQLLALLKQMGYSDADLAKLDWNALLAALRNKTPLPEALQRALGGGSLPELLKQLVDNPNDAALRQQILALLKQMGLTDDQLAKLDWAKLLAALKAGKPVNDAVQEAIGAGPTPGLAEIAKKIAEDPTNAALRQQLLALLKQLGYTDEQLAKFDWDKFLASLKAGDPVLVAVEKALKSGMLPVAQVAQLLNGLFGDAKIGKRGDYTEIKQDSSGVLIKEINRQPAGWQMVGGKPEPVEPIVTTSVNWQFIISREANGFALKELTPDQPGKGFEVKSWAVTGPDGVKKTFPPGIQLVYELGAPGSYAIEAKIKTQFETEATVIFKTTKQ